MGHVRIDVGVLKSSDFVWGLKNVAILCNDPFLKMNCPRGLTSLSVNVALANCVLGLIMQ